MHWAAFWQQVSRSVWPKEGQWIQGEAPAIGKLGKFCYNREHSKQTTTKFSFLWSPSKRNSDLPSCVRNCTSLSDPMCPLMTYGCLSSLHQPSFWGPPLHHLLSSSAFHKLLSSCWSLVHVRALEITIWIPPCPSPHLPSVTAPGEGQEPAPEGTPLLHPLFILRCPGICLWSLSFTASGQSLHYLLAVPT